RLAMKLLSALGRDNGRRNVGCNAAKRHCTDATSPQATSPMGRSPGAIALRTIAPYLAPWRYSRSGRACGFMARGLMKPPVVGIFSRRTAGAACGAGADAGQTGAVGLCPTERAKGWKKPPPAAFAKNVGSPVIARSSFGAVASAPGAAPTLRA